MQGRGRQGAVGRIVREALSTRAFEACDAECANNDRHHHNYIRTANTLTATLVNQGDALVIKFVLHTFKGCNTGFNSYTFNKLVGDLFRGRTDIDSVIKMLNGDAIPEAKALGSEERKIFNELSRMERNAIRGAFYDTKYKPRGTNSIISDRSWYHDRYDDSTDDASILSTPPSSFTYRVGSDSSGRPITATIDRNRFIKDYVRSKRHRIPPKTLECMKGRCAHDIAMFKWYEGRRGVRAPVTIHTVGDW